MQLTVNQDANNSSWHGNPYFVNTRYKIQALFNKRRGQRFRYGGDVCLLPDIHIFT